MVEVCGLWWLKMFFGYWRRNVLEEENVNKIMVLFKKMRRNNSNKWYLIYIIIYSGFFLIFKFYLYYIY